MNVQRATRIVPPEAVVTAECRANFLGGAWGIWARGDGYEQLLTQFASGDPFSAAHWLAEFDKCRHFA